MVATPLLPGATPAPTAASPASPRLAWPDVAKGVSILGVVVLHVSLVVPYGTDSFIAQVNHLLDPLRMPLFFLVSGMFSTKILRYSLWDLFSRRLWFFVVPYVVWAPVEIFAAEYERSIWPDYELPGVWHYVVLIAQALNMYWFLYVLVAFNLIAWLTRRLPRWAALLISLSPVLLLPLNAQVDTVGKFIMYLPIFIVGLRWSQSVRGFAGRGFTPGAIVGSTCAYVAGFGCYAVWYLLVERGMSDMPWRLWPWNPTATIEPNDLWTLVRGGGQVLMLPVAVLAAVGVARVPYLSRALQFLGRNTLPIYLGHPLALTLLYRLPMSLSGGRELHPEAERMVDRPGVWIALAMVCALSGGVVMWLIQRVPIVGWTVHPPQIVGLASWWKTAAARRERGSAAHAGAGRGAQRGTRPQRAGGAQDQRQLGTATSGGSVGCGTG